MSGTTETLVIRMPTHEAQRLRRVAEIAQRPVDEVVADTLRASLPPLLEDVPLQMRADLAALERSSNDELRNQMGAEFNPEWQTIYDDLLAAKSAGAITMEMQRRLDDLRQEADRLMFRKAYAALLLKWRGQRIPTLANIEA
jgi:hypothetical protein